MDVQTLDKLHYFFILHLAALIKQEWDWGLQFQQSHTVVQNQTDLHNTTSYLEHRLTRAAGWGQK
jgi:hypothetical protein